ncbi:MAG: translesion DNA synthesis-associated protein ImuA [Pseudomonadales bacterium]
MRRPPNRPNARLADLLAHPALWQAGRLDTAAAATPSGFSALDAHLPGGGWPQAGLAELLLATAGVGELRLLAPLMAALSRQQPRWVAWIAPPFVPYAPALEAQGVQTDRLLLVHPATHPQTLWALERAGRSGSCSLILGWLDERRLRAADTRRLKLAAHQGNCLICLFRPEQAAARSSMAELRLRLTPAAADCVTVDIRKRRGGWPVDGIRVPFAERQGAVALQAQLDRWRQWLGQRQAMSRPVGLEHDREPAMGRPGVVH